jgi:hypothetical protein
MRKNSCKTFFGWGKIPIVSRDDVVLGQQVVQDKYVSKSFDGLHLPGGVHLGREIPENFWSDT